MTAWCYEEQLFNEPYEGFFEILTSKGEEKGKGKGGKKKSGSSTTTIPERTALLPMRSSPGQPYSRDVETQEVKKLQEASMKIEQQIRLQAQVVKEKEARLAALRAA